MAFFYAENPKCEDPPWRFLHFRDEKKNFPDEKGSWNEKMWESEYQKIGRNIRLIRVNMGISQHELAQRLGMAQASLSAMEHGKSPLTLRKLFQIRDALDCEMKDFFKDEKNETDITVEEVVEAMRIMKQIKLAEAREN